MSGNGIVPLERTQLSVAKSLTVTFMSLYLLAGMAGCVRTGDLRVLASLGKEAQLQQKTFEEETVRYNRAVNVIRRGKLAVGMAEERVRRLIGQPVVAFEEEGIMKYVYKPGTADWFDGEKIYLVFDDKNTLIRWECSRLNGSPTRS